MAGSALLALWDDASGSLWRVQPPVWSSRGLRRHAGDHADRASPENVTQIAANVDAKATPP